MDLLSTLTQKSVQQTAHNVYIQCQIYILITNNIECAVHIVHT